MGILTIICILLASRQNSRHNGWTLRRQPFLILGLLLFVSPAFAHPEGFSGFRFLVWQDKAKAILTLHTRDMGAWFPSGKYPNYSEGVCRDIIAQPTDLLEVHFDDVPVTPIDKQAFVPETGMIQVELTYPIAKMPAVITVWSKHLVRLPRGHQQLFFAEDMRRQPDAQSGSALSEATLTVEEDNTTFDIPHFSGIASTAPASTPSANPRGRISFFLLGVEHIATGYDHLLFLAALLLVSKNFREAASVVTFFTVAHSITLSLAALDIIRLPGRIVEPAIAASILYVGVENVVGKHRFALRAAITFAFGLVHGLGFAGALREVGLGSTPGGVAWPLFKFSVGLESCQILIALVFLRILLFFRAREWFEQRLVPACSMLIAGIGAFWLIQRVAAG
jgi:hydrogenase/urease accessory protein HupE